jgi:hypothetical protein
MIALVRLRKSLGALIALPALLTAFAANAESAQCPTPAPWERAWLTETETGEMSIGYDVSAVTGIARVDILGEISPDGPAQFERLVNELNQKGCLVSSVHLRSPGGSARAGIRIGELIHRYKLQTFCEYGPMVNDPWWYDFIPVSPPTERMCQCYSACAFAWLGGLVRYGQPGFHQPYIVQEKSDFAVADTQLRDLWSEARRYMLDMGLSNEMVDKIMETGRQNIVPLDGNHQIHPRFKSYLDGVCPRDLTRTENELWFKLESSSNLSAANRETLARMREKIGNHWSCVWREARRASAAAQLGNR